MSNNREPLISVIIAIYNPGKYLRGCLDSIVGQTYKNLEIILVDDGSTDDSLSVCNEYAEKDSRVIVHHKENSGVSATRNVGIRLARGDYFSFIDSDDYLEKDTYEYLMNIVNTHGVDAVNYEHFITFPNREQIHQLNDKNYGEFYRHQAIHQLVHNVLFAWNKLFSRKIIEGVFFDETIARGEDSLFSIMAFDKADKIWFEKRPLYHYIQSENSAVRGKFRKSQLTAVNLIDIYEPFFSEKYPELYDAQMGIMLNLMTTLYFDMKADQEKLKREKKLVRNKFKELYKKVNLNKLPKKSRNKLKIFKFSPLISYSIRKCNLLMGRLKHGK